MIKKVREKNLDSQLWDRWLTLYPYMEKKEITFLTFDEYKKRLLKPNVTTKKNKEDIIAESEKIKKADLNSNKSPTN